MACNISSLNILHKNQRNFSNCLNCFLQSCKTFFHNKTILILIRFSDSYFDSYLFRCIKINIRELFIIIIVLNEVREDVLLCLFSKESQLWGLLLLLLFLLFFDFSPLSFRRWSRCSILFSFLFQFVLLSSFLMFGFATNGSLDAAF